MSYFGLHPYQPFHQQQPRPAAHAQPYPFASGHAGYPFATAPAAAAPQYNFYASSPTPPDLSFNTGRSLEDEERAAIAHLRSIQRRKEAERIVREEAERERLVAQLQAHREHQLAAAAARAERERERRAALAVAEYERKVAIARRVQQIEAAQARQAEAHRRQQAIAAIAHAEQQRERTIAAKNAISERRGQCARQCAARRQTQSDSREDGLDEFSRFLASIFGVAVNDEVTADGKKPEDTADAPASAPAEAKKEEPVAATSVADPAEPVLPATEAVPATQSENSEPATDKRPEFPEAINDLLANFLGLRVEPDSKLGQAVSDKVPQGLNELLGQFGLEFVPDATAAQAAPAFAQPEAGPSEQKKPAPESDAQATSAESSQPRHPFDLSEFLSGPNSLPPFVRDILGNVEQAFKNEQQAQKEEVKKDEGKGKGVAEGEKKAPAPAPTPAPAPEPVVDEKKVSSDSLAKLDSIASEIKLATDTFTFPSALSFSHNAPAETVPSLLFNKQNKPYHAQNNKLLQLLLQADGVASNGDREVRRKRKEVVKQVEGELERLEQKRDEYWRQVRDRREQGEVSSDDESSSWTTGSAVDHTEDHPVHVEDVAAPAPEPEPETAVPEAEKEKAIDTADSAETDAHPTTFAEAVKSDTKPEVANAAVQESSVEITSVPAEEKAKKSENEEGYELI